MLRAIFARGVGAQIVMKPICIADLPDPIMAAKADWLVASHWIGFTPASNAIDAVPRCQATIAGQFGSGYVIEYITRNFGSPNPGFENDPNYIRERAEHQKVAGRLVAVHRLRASARPLRVILGESDYERMQDMWAEPGKRDRWSVAFPIVESYEIKTQPLARDVFSAAAMQRLFAHPSATLRPLNDGERSALVELPLVLRPTANAWVAIEDEIAAAEALPLDKKIQRLIDDDLRDVAIEGLTAEQTRRVRLRAAWIAQKFVLQRQRAGTLRCDHCEFDPAALTQGTLVRPRSLLDVHHLHPLAEGRRPTTVRDFGLLCPTCHRFEHALQRVTKLEGRV